MEEEGEGSTISHKRRWQRLSVFSSFTDLDGGAVINCEGVRRNTWIWFSPS